LMRCEEERRGLVGCIRGHKAADLLFAFAL